VVLAAPRKEVAGAVIGQHCSVGSLPPITLRQKGNALVFP
jgi:hypothetical protein